MSLLPSRDLLTVPRTDGQVNRESVPIDQNLDSLSHISPHHKSWDIHRFEADEVADLFADSQFSRHRRYATRIDQCSQVLEFARSPPAQNPQRKLKLASAWFCRVRHCPVCQWRRAIQWQARLYQALPRLMVDYPDARFLFLTLTVKNCPVTALRSTLIALGRGWQRLIQLRVWPATGWVRSTEITRSPRDRSAHPHFHALLMVPPTYFQAGYLKQSQWAELWQQCLRIDYQPVVDVRVIRQNARRSAIAVNQVNISQMWAIVTEILKYSVKPSDMIRDPQWFLTLVDEVHKMRSVAVGGVLKSYLRARQQRDDLTQEPGEEAAHDIAERLYFQWAQQVRRYQRVR